MDDVRRYLDSLLAKEPVVLFMKGTRTAPACGFSAKVVDLLDELLEEYVTVDVLADERLRDGVKAYAEWPTFPQLWANGKFVGGADIVADMAREGELGPALGATGPLAFREPEISVTDAAVAAFREYSASDSPQEGATKPDVRMVVGRDFDVELDLAEPRAGDVVLDLGNVRLSMDRASARRADGVRIDFARGATGVGFRVDNPNAPPKVKNISVEELDAIRKSGKPHLLIDVRTPQERAIASLEGSELLDAALAQKLDDLDHDVTLVLHCHHGGRSRAAAERLIAKGFRDVSNVEGGIDAWSLRIDSTVPRY